MIIVATNIFFVNKNYKSTNIFFVNKNYNSTNIFKKI